MKACQISSFFIIIFCILPLQAQTNSQNSVMMPTIPTVSQPTVPTVTYPSDVTLSNDVSPYATSSSQTATSTTTSQDSSTNSSLSSIATDSEISSLAASALQQLSGSSSFDTSALTDALINTTSSSLQTTDIASSSAKTDAAPITENTKRYGSILRCNINNFNQIGAFKQFWISKPEANGSFLFTGTYINQNTTDTFYMYFIPESSNMYKVSVSNTNPTDTVFSTLASLTKTIALTAQRTGNLVAINLTSDSITIDMLLSINF